MIWGKILMIVHALKDSAGGVATCYGAPQAWQSNNKNKTNEKPRGFAAMQQNDFRYCITSEVDHAFIAPR